MQAVYTEKISFGSNIICDAYPLPKVTRAFVAGNIVQGTYFDLFTNFVKKKILQY